MTLPVTSGLVHHWDANEGLTLSGSEVTQINDLSGSGNHGTPLAGDVGGQLVTGGLNGKNYISFNGTDESLEKSSPSNLPATDTDRTIFWVGRCPDTGSDIFGYVYGRNQTHQAWAVIMAQDAPDRLELAISGNTYASNTDGYDEWSTWGFTYTQTGDVLAFLKDGASQGGASATNVFTGATSMDTIRIGANLGGSNSPADFAELVMFNRVLDSGEMTAMWAYFDAKYFAVTAGPPDLVAGSSTVSSPTAAKASVPSVAPDALTSTGTVFGPTVSDATAGTVEPDLVASTSSAFVPTVADASVPDVAPDALANTDTVFGPTVFHSDLPVSTGLVLHLDSSLGVTVSGSNVTLWEDQSPSGNDMVPIGADDGPTVVSGGLNGHDYLVFDGIGQSLEKASPTNLPSFDDDRTVLLMGRFPDSGPSIRVGFSYGRDQTDQAFPFKMDEGAGLLYVNIGGTTYTGTLGGFDEWASWSATHTDSGNVLQLYKNNVDAGSFSATTVWTGATSMDSIRVGRGLNGQLSEFWIAELIIYNRVLDSGELAAMETYFEQKFFPIVVGPPDVVGNTNTIFGHSTAKVVADLVGPADVVASAAQVFGPTVEIVFVTASPDPVGASSSVFDATVSKASALSVVPDAVAASDSVLGPTASKATPLSVAPDTASASSLAFDPSVSKATPADVQPGFIGGVSDAAAPTVAMAAAFQVDPDTVASTASIFEPTVALNVPPMPDVVPSSATVPPPVVAHASVPDAQPDFVASAGVVPSQTVAKASVPTASPDVVSTGDQVQAPSVAMVPGYDVAPDLVSSSASIAQPVVAKASVPSVAPSMVGVESQVFAPDVDEIANPDRAPSESQAFDPVVAKATVLSVQPSVVGAESTVENPTVDMIADAIPGLVQNYSASVLPPTLTAIPIPEISPSRVQQSSATHAPTVAKAMVPVSAPDLVVASGTVHQPAASKASVPSVAPDMAPVSGLVLQPEVAPIAGPPDVLGSTSLVFGASIAKATVVAVAPDLVEAAGTVPFHLVLKQSTRTGDRDVTFSGRSRSVHGVRFKAR